ncbi:uncharacterized protein G2W53_039552 [Senna tora]|uniref:Uncharacterized protein n=1 Tax=Senna tora TaxID=362788 RepID=A0A834SPP6_9FABA|nr:uncharacterized protein G2W53_039552 [Senna tora]
MQGIAKDGLYAFDNLKLLLPHYSIMPVSASHSYQVNHVQAKSPFKTWHSRLGHASSNIVNIVLKQWVGLDSDIDMMKGDLDAMGYKGNYDLWYANPNGRLEDELKPIIDDTQAMDMARKEKTSEEDEEEEESSEGEEAKSSDENNEEAADESVEDSAASITFGDSEEEEFSKGYFQGDGPSEGRTKRRFDKPAEQHNVIETETESENQAKQVFPRFKPLKDMANYKFDLGTIFGSKTEFIDEVKTHAVHNGKPTKFIKNDKQRVRVICVGGTEVKPCHWTLTTMKSNSKTKIKELMYMAKRKWSRTLKKGKASRAKKIAPKKMHGSNTEQFKSLFDFCHELLRSNLGSTVKLSTFDAPNMQSLVIGGTAVKFERLYICLDACKKSFLASRKGLLPSISELLPNVDQRFCVWHLYNNFRKKFPGQSLKELM